MRRLSAAIGALTLPLVLLVPTSSPAAPTACTVRGTAGNDLLVGTRRADVICGLGGNDVIRGRAGDDEIRGGDGNDVIYPGRGSNTVQGNSGSDTLRYDDLTTGSVSVDLVAGVATRAVSDTVATIESVVGTNGNDRLVGNAGYNRFQGRGGDDVLLSGNDRDRLLGGEGDDVIRPGRGDDFADGGPGTDLLSYQDVIGLGVAVSVDLAAGKANGDGPGADEVLGFENLIGTRSYDVLKGTDGPNMINGNQGNDHIYPRLGDDEIFGGGSYRGREGDYLGDVLNYSDLTTTGITLDFNSGSVQGPGDTTIHAIDNVVATNQADTIVDGGDGWRLISALGGADVIEGPIDCGHYLGGDGDDTIYPGTSAGCGDIFPGVSGGQGTDTVSFAGRGSPVWSTEAGAGWAVYEDEFGSGEITVTSVAVLVGTSGADHLEGGLGQPWATFVGMGGADEIDTVDGYGGDTIQGGPESTCVGDPGDTVDC